MSEWENEPKRIFAVTLFVEDLAVASTFYRDVFNLPVHFENENSAIFMFDTVMINLLQATSALDLIAPAVVAPPTAGSRVQFTVAVTDVDATCEALARHHVELLNGPLDRPWGVRTASFQDPGGHIWEVAQQLQ